MNISKNEDDYIDCTTIIERMSKFFNSWSFISEDTSTRGRWNS